MAKGLRKFTYNLVYRAVCRLTHSTESVTGVWYDDANGSTHFLPLPESEKYEELVGKLSDEEFLDLIQSTSVNANLKF